MDAFERLIWWLFVLSAGAPTRARVLLALKEQPSNAQQLSQRLKLDYTTIRHHLGVLEQNRMVVTEGEKYGKVYFISELMESHWAHFQAIQSKIKRDAKKDGGAR
jgi:DNA-binding transcriptional ArsR family regulator